MASSRYSGNEVIIIKTPKRISMIGASDDESESIFEAEITLNPDHISIMPNRSITPIQLNVLVTVAI